MKRFEGWEPATLYQYSDAGILIQSRPETEWDADERGWMLAIAEYRHTRCTRCGGDLEESTDIDNEDRYEHTPPIQCHRCVAFARAEVEYQDQPYPHTLSHRVQLRRGR